MLHDGDYLPPEYAMLKMQIIRFVILRNEESSSIGIVGLHT